MHSLRGLPQERLRYLADELSRVGDYSHSHDIKLAYWLADKIDKPPRSEPLNEDTLDLIDRLSVEMQATIEYLRKEKK